jgi:xanthine dehydrogenase accessory factor
MVGSRRRGEACRDYLRTSGLPEHQIARLKVPAGLDLGAVTPEEIAASILAELVQVKRRGRVARENDSNISTQDHLQGSENTGNSVPATALDPVCGMIVEIASARHRSTYDGREFYFCCPACKRQFERNPHEYLVHDER